ncbi:hypothetical protein OGAPHI_005281 [Ogataea philodendri]|uniref:PUM-HD domain-containing protein n=1 Tax=Ogataea philodendri TaxID=1378263 RepID=A0A9P8P131_9ASCO|nr:uncharacterized protein OGAPHI_005281 [Ogataea philodendri]KAH3663878.1 hypothetical protein OGAPHI_005281 [Ogataea philodendri]
MQQGIPLFGDFQQAPDMLLTPPQDKQPATMQQPVPSIDLSNFMMSEPAGLASSLADPLNSCSVSSASNVGIRTRHRSGTLPTKLSSSAGPMPSATNTSTTPLLPPETNHLNVSISPGLNAVYEDSNLLNQPTQTRIRSASIQSSIWSDQQDSSSTFLPVPQDPNNTLLQIPQLNIDLDSILSSATSTTIPSVPSVPSGSATSPASSTNRIRSYSANNALFNPSEKLFLQQYTPIKEEFVPPVNFGLLDDTNGRPRSHTSGVFPQPSSMPLLQDNLPELCISITSTHTNPSLGPTNTLLFINIPNDKELSNALNFYKMLNQFGPMTSVRIVTCSENPDLVAIVEFVDVESAMRCKSKMNFQELMPGLCCLVSFAKILSLNDKPSSLGVPILPVNREREESAAKSSKMTILNDKFFNFQSSLNVLLQKISLSASERNHLNIMVSNALNYPTIRKQDLGKLPAPAAVRHFDTPKLREIRKQLDSHHLSKIEIEELALAMHDELPELASDYLGNTIVQKLFEVCDNPIRDSMIKKLAPYFAQTGAHKNGTWAAQKVINTIATDREKWMVANALKPYCTQLFNDQYANYVIHGVLKFGEPYNDFISETMLSTFLELSKNRFGARAVRTCLESESVSRETVVAIAACVITWFWELVVDSNGSILITWFLDTCQLVDDRHLMLTQLLLSESSDESQFVKLCCSKVGNLSVLKLLSFRGDNNARDLILKEIFGQDLFEHEDCVHVSEALRQILNDKTSNGSTFIYKVLSLPTIDAELRKRISSRIRYVLQDPSLSGHQYKRLYEEVGLKRHQRPSTGAHKKKTRSRSNSSNDPHAASGDVDYDAVLRQQLEKLSVSQEQQLFF